jgi:hypothetical protein
MQATQPTHSEPAPLVTHAILVGEPGDLAASALDALLEHAADRPARVTIIGVASRPLLIHYWAPVTGLITLAAIKETAMASASQAARNVAASLPRGISVQHRAARCWADALRLVEGRDVVVVSGQPRCRRDRARLTAISLKESWEMVSTEKVRLKAARTGNELL